MQSFSWHGNGSMLATICKVNDVTVTSYLTVSDDVIRKQPAQSSFPTGQQGEETPDI